MVIFLGSLRLIVSISALKSIELLSSGSFQCDTLVRETVLQQAFGMPSSQALQLDHHLSH